jgi:pimeloyl-ACP methyl ester carboxylesterase
MVATPSAFSIFFSPAMPREEIARLQARAQAESFRAFVDGVLTPLARPRPAAVPTLLVSGSEDAMFTVDEERKMADYHGAEFDLFRAWGTT